MIGVRDQESGIKKTPTISPPIRGGLRGGARVAPNLMGAIS